MGKQGPCHHCGVTSTPLWRNGPPEKPILCNACGSRWRTKGTLANYTPLHARAEPDDFEDYRIQRGKAISIKNKEPKVLKRKKNHEHEVLRGVVTDYYGFQKSGGVVPEYNQGFRKVLDEDTSNRSSSGSAISNSESCLQLLGTADASDLTEPSQSIVWDAMVPSRKRTCVTRPKPSSVEKLTKDLYTILHEQNSYFSGSSEEDLLFESDTPMVSVEMGHGSVLIRHPSSIAREEESEASSLSFDNKPYRANGVYSQLTSLPVHTPCKGVNFSYPGFESVKKPIPEMEHVKREKAQHEKLQILGTHNSQLCYIELTDVLNFEEFVRLLTNDEQQQLLKYLPSIDTHSPDSIKSMFDSLEFKEDLSAFQKLLAEGVFNASSAGVKSEYNRTLQRLALSNLAKSNWVEQYNLLKEKGKSGIGGLSVEGEHFAIASAQSVKMKRPRDGQFQNFPGSKTTMKSPKGFMMKTNYEHKEQMDSDANCFSPKSLFALPADSSMLMLESLQFGDEISDQDLLLDIPPNGTFAQAELLLPASSFGAQASTSSSSIYQNHVHPR